ncbi:hypothetical protein N7474_009695 [Penicillium riverlandense]|uniref:uncharacterized protein n=1 Tax=Penicillium riverlandense TaxID=1903569 RepID=UPI002547A340|nr:uncharacterized protein N7474_009695 [Penicillium riverlandense]KAJ5808426.1 hypothetical protein N7474_009695 [Penicillium riverlandense]
MRFLLVYSLFAAVPPVVSSCIDTRAETSLSGTFDPSLFDMIPECARNCVDNFIESQYTSTECKMSTDVECLCRTPSTDGFTLGEAALSCALSLCSKKTIESTNAYHICDSVHGAVPAMHATITATVFPAVQTTTATDATATEEPTKTTSTSTSEQTSDISPFTTSTTSNGFPVTTPQNTATASNPSSAKEEDHHTISPGAVIGVSVVSGVAGSFIIGIAVFFCCKRYRRGNPNDSDQDFFEIGGAMTEPPGFSHPSSRHASPDPTPDSPWDEKYGAPQSASPVQSASQPTFTSVSEVSYAGRSRNQDHIGVAVSSDSEWAVSPMTQSSQRTLSEVLPYQTPGLYPKPLKWSHRPVSGVTLFEEEEEGQQVTPPEEIRSSPSRSQAPIGLPANPRAVKEGFPAGRFLRDAVHSQSHLTTPTTTAMRGSSTTTTDASSALDDFRSSPSPHLSSPTTLATTPSSTAQGRILSGMFPSRKPPPLPPKQPPARTLDPALEIISRPRIVRQNDIKRVQLRPGQPRPPSEVVVPYDPEELWLERGRSYMSQNAVLPYPSAARRASATYPDSPTRVDRRNPHRLSPESRNVVVSQQGNDFVLRVE